MQTDKLARFEQSVLPYLNAAHNLAYWLVHNHHDAEDVVQDAFLRAFEFFDGFHDGNARAWILTIVRNTSYSWLQRNRSQVLVTEFNEEAHSLTGNSPDPEILMQRASDTQLMKDALDQLPLPFREVLVLREIQDLSYKEIVEVTHLPLGTVMSRLARGRKRLQQYLVENTSQGVG